MSMSVALSELEAALCERGDAAYVITVNDQGTPHVVLAEVTRREGVLLATVGPRTTSFAERRPHVSLAYPIREPSDYTLIIGAIATVTSTTGGTRMRLAPTRACSTDLVTLPRPPSPPVGRTACPCPSGRVRSGDTGRSWASCRARGTDWDGAELSVASSKAI